MPAERAAAAGPGACLIGEAPRGYPDASLIPFGHAPRGPQTGRLATMSQNYENLVKAVNDARGDVEKAEAGNKAATSRVRKAMMDIKNIAQEIRKEMLEVRDAGGTSGGGGAKPAAPGAKPMQSPQPKPPMGR